MVKIKNKNKHMLKVEETHNEELEHLMHRLYVLQDMKMDDVCRYLNLPRKTFIKWMKEAHIFSHRLKTLEDALREDLEEEGE